MLIKPCGRRSGKKTKNLIQWLIMRITGKPTRFGGYVEFFLGKKYFKVHVAENDTVDDIKAKIEKETGRKDLVC